LEGSLQTPSCLRYIVKKPQRIEKVGFAGRVGSNDEQAVTDAYLG